MDDANPVVSISQTEADENDVCHFCGDIGVDKELW